MSELHTPAIANSSLELKLLGPLNVIDEQTSINFPTAKARALLAYLIVERKTAHPRRRLARLFWPDTSDDRALRNLTTTFMRIRQALGDHGGLILSNAHALQFHPNTAITIDLSSFDQLLAQCAAHPHRAIERCATCAERLTVATQLVRGPLLAGLSLHECDEFMNWLMVVRERYHHEWIRTLMVLATFHEYRREYDQAIGYLNRILLEEPWREEVHCQIMRLFGHQGERSAALRQFVLCRKALKRELGVTPEPATEALAAAIRLGRQGDEERSLIRIPATHTRFVGRTMELQQIVDGLCRNDRRMVTIIGPGGVGKSTLAIQAAKALTFAFRDGVVFVPLAAAPDFDAALLTIGAAVGCDFVAEQPLIIQLADFLLSRELLLVLDNLEHLTAHGDLLAQLLITVPTLSLLVTSRRRFNLRIEHVLELHGLGLPPLDAPDPNQFSAVQLFLERAHQQLPNRHWIAELDAIVRICRLLDGLPLGIELAAVQARSRSCAALADLLADRMSVLATAMPDIPPRHRRLDAIFAYSWQELSPSRRQVLQVLAIFQGSFSLAAVDAIIPDQELQQTLSALIDQALLYTPSGGRYVLHPLLRRYALEQPDPSDSAAEARDRHMHYYLDQLNDLATGVVNPQTRARATELAEEIEHIHLAWKRAIAQLNLDLLARSGPALTLLARCRGWLARGAAMLREASTALATFPPDSTAGHLYAQLLLLEGRLSHQLGDLNRTLQIAWEAHERFQLLGSAGGVARALWLQGMLLCDAGDYAQAHTLLTAASGLVTAEEEPATVAEVQRWLGRVALEQGALDAAQVHFQCGLELFRAHNEWYGIIGCLNALAQLPARQGDLLASLAPLEEVLVYARELGEQRSLSTVLENVGAVRVKVGMTPEPALALLEEGIEIRRQYGNPVWLGWGIHSLAYAYIYLRRYDDARHQLSEALKMVAPFGVRPELLELIEGVGLLYAHMGRYTEATELLALVVEYPVGSSFTRIRARNELDTLAQKLAAEPYQAAYKRGAARAPVALALELAQELRRTP
jgi:DNA-binding SARP family transcriptional activator/predicted ATPase